MRRFEHLNENLRQEAINHFTKLVAQNIADGNIMFEGHIGDLISSVVMQAFKQNTPWFAADMLFENTEINNIIKDIALEMAQDALYPEAGEESPVYVKLSDWNE